MQTTAFDNSTLDQPQRGILLISEGEINKWMKKYPTYQFKLIAKTQRKRTETKRYYFVYSLRKEIIYKSNITGVALFVV